MLKLYVICGMIIENVHETFSFKQSRWLEKYKYSNTQKRNLAKNDFEKVFFILLNDSFYQKTMENGRNRIKLEFIRKDNNEKIYNTTMKTDVSWKS